MSNPMAIIGAIISFITGFAFLKYVIMSTIRLRESDRKALYLKISGPLNGRKFVINEELIRDKSEPRQYRGLFKVKGIPCFYINFSKRMLQAGWRSSELISEVYCFRWSRKKVLRFIDNAYQGAQDSTPAYLIGPYAESLVGKIKAGSIKTPHVDPEFLTHVETDIQKVLTGETERSGILLYGPAGVGKSVLIRYLAMKFKLPIKIPSFRQDMNNDDVIMMFANISDEAPCIILMEDFDRLFDGERCLLGSENTPAKFTFDTILNCLDGPYMAMNGVVIIITANDINKVDNAIRYRPSRVRFIKHMTLPDFKTRKSILQDSEMAKLTKGSNLDSIYMIRRMMDNGDSMEQIMNQINERRPARNAQKPKPTITTASRGAGK